MKYRRLEEDQLHAMEKEFIDFLVVNGITADDWVQIKAAQASKAKAIIDQFSDTVWEGILRKGKYLVRFTPSSLYCFKCDADQIHLIKLNDHRAIADLTDPKYREQAIDGSMHITIQRASKSYVKSREEDMFELMTNGCELSDSKLFDSIAQ